MKDAMAVCCGYFMPTQVQNNDKILFYCVLGFGLFLVLNAIALVYTNKPCSKYPPTISTMVLRGLDMVIILLTWALTKLFPTMIIIAIKMQT